MAAFKLALYVEMVFNGNSYPKLGNGFIAGFLKKADEFMDSPAFWDTMLVILALMGVFILCCGIFIFYMVLTGGG